MLADAVATYECLRCNAEVTGATRGDMREDGWVFYRLPGPDVTLPHTMRGMNDVYSAGRDVAICGDCAAMIRTLQAIRAAKEAA